MNLGVALAECRTGRAPSGSDGAKAVGYLEAMLDGRETCKVSAHAVDASTRRGRR